MIDINFIKSYSNRLKDVIDSINFAEVIIDDSQMVNFLEERSTSDEHLLFTVIPDFANAGASADNIKKQTDTFILVLQKTDYSDVSHTEFLQIMQETLISARAIETQMIKDKYDYSAEGCQYMKLLNVGSVRITPVWKMAGCNGWSIEFNFEEL
jgi:hypothetical protein